MSTYLFAFNALIPIQISMWGDVWRPEFHAEAEISAAILDDRKAYDKAQEFDIGILQGINMRRISKI